MLLSTLILRSHLESGWSLDESDTSFQWNKTGVTSSFDASFELTKCMIPFSLPTANIENIQIHMFPYLDGIIEGGSDCCFCCCCEGCFVFRSGLNSLAVVSQKEGQQATCLKLQYSSLASAPIWTCEEHPNRANQ